MDKTPFYTAKRAEEVALDALKRLHVLVCHAGASYDDDSLVRDLTLNILEKTFSREVDTLRSRFGTSKQQKMLSLANELTRRGILWTDVHGDLSCVNVNIGGSRFRINSFIGISLALLPPDDARVPVKIHLCNAKTGDIADFLTFFSTVQTKIAEGIRRRVSLEHKAALLCEIEFPFVEQKVRAFMDPRGLDYSLKISSRKILFEVLAASGIWVRSTLTAQNVEKALERMKEYL